MEFRWLAILSYSCEHLSQMTTDLLVSVGQMPPGGGQDDFVESRDCSPTTTWPRSREPACFQRKKESLVWPCCPSQRTGRSLQSERETLWESHTSSTTAFVVNECKSRVTPSDRKTVRLEMRLCFKDCLTPGSAFLHSPFEYRTKLFIVFIAFSVFSLLSFISCWGFELKHFGALEWSMHNRWDQAVIFIFNMSFF